LPPRFCRHSWRRLARARLGWAAIEGICRRLSSFAKAELRATTRDQLKKRKPLAVFGYAFNGAGGDGVVCNFATSPFLPRACLLGGAAAWLGAAGVPFAGEEGRCLRLTFPRQGRMAGRSGWERLMVYRSGAIAGPADGAVAAEHYQITTIAQYFCGTLLPGNDRCVEFLVAGGVERTF